MTMKRREFLVNAGELAAGLSVAGAAHVGRPHPGDLPMASNTTAGDRVSYEGTSLERIAFPMGGFGAGMVCLEGAGALSNVSVRNRSEVWNEPCLFAAVFLKEFAGGARVLEGPVPRWKLVDRPGACQGLEHHTYGLPRFRNAHFSSRFPFATVRLTDQTLPFTAEVTGWSPFVPGDADGASLPVAALEYRLTNTSHATLAGIFSYHARNFMVVREDDEHGVFAAPGGFALWGADGKSPSRREGAFAISVTEPDSCVNHAWFRGPWWDGLTMAWKDVEAGACVARPPIREGQPAVGASLFVPFELAPGASRLITVRLAWYVPHSYVRWNYDEDLANVDKTEASNFYRPWYTTRFSSVDDVVAYWAAHYLEIKQRTEQFTNCFYDSTLAPDAIEAVARNLSILKSPTVLREPGGRLWGWEGSGEYECNGPGTCTHVWNYAQAVAHLFPELERSLRNTEFNDSQDARGHQAFRSAIPLRSSTHTFHAASDGQSLTRPAVVKSFLHHS